MPGLFGYWAGDRQSAVNDRLTAMAASMQHQPGLKTELSAFPGFCAGRVHLGYFQPEPQPCTEESHRYSLWLDGEFNNGANLRQTYKLDDLAAAGDGALALALFRKSGWDFLEAVDGLFIIALYDQLLHQLTLVNDRFGLRPLYCADTAQGFGYAGEAKALLQIPGLKAGIDPLAVKEWFSFGLLLENRTWIPGIELLPPATILTVDTRRIRQVRYWSWQEIKLRATASDEMEIAEELGRLWHRAVERRVDDKRVGQLLSGGLDSRAILAALPATNHPYHTITFGSLDCDDARIARRVSNLKGVEHHFVEIKKLNWLKTRAGAVWRTDGMGRFLDFHGSRALPMLKQYFDVQLHGFLGDATIGGSYLGDADVFSYMNSKIILKTRSGLEMADALGYIMRIFRQNGLPPERFLLHQRGRRFINTGLISSSAFVETRLPYFDFAFLSFGLSLPDSLRAGSHIYNKMLLHFFPRFYHSIPWQRTGLSIDPSPWIQTMNSLLKFARRAVRYAASKLGTSYLAGSEHYADYPRWLREDPGRSFIIRLLLNRDALYGDYLDREVTRQVVVDFMDTGNNRNLTTIGLLLTFEIYLHQLFGHDLSRFSLEEPEPLYYDQP